MVLDTVIVGFTAEWLVDSIAGVVRDHPSLSQEWVGLILLPIVCAPAFLPVLADGALFRLETLLSISPLSPFRSRTS